MALTDGGVSTSLEADLGSAIEAAHGLGGVGPGLVQLGSGVLDESELLSRVAEVVRPADLAVHRWDGSVILLLPRVHERDLLGVAQRLARRLRAPDGTCTPIGICMSWPGARPAELLACLDRAVELARAEGLPFHLHEIDAPGWSAVAVQNLSDRLRRAEEIDELTGLGNRTRLRRRLEELAGGEGPVPAIVFCDLDRFGLINKLVSNREGDDALRRVAGVLADGVDPDDLFRIGGEELVILVDDPDPAQVAEGLRLRLQDAGIEHPANPPWGCVTASFGVELPGRRDDLVDALDQADSAMRRAKAAGRNQVVVNHRLPVRSG